jgi:hypothetical protein
MQIVTETSQKWTDLLDEDELGFVKQFVLASGSLKDLATRYGVSYPTVRLRMDRLIQRIELHDKFHERSETERKLRAFYAEGRIPDDVFKSLLNTARKELP